MHVRRVLSTEYETRKDLISILKILTLLKCKWNLPKVYQDVLRYDLHSLRIAIAPFGKQGHADGMERRFLWESSG